MQNPETAPFSNEQWAQITNLLDQLTVSQSQWLIDYLNQQYAASAKPRPDHSGRIAVVYGSETGNSKGVAELFHDIAIKQGKPLELLNLANIKVRQLNQFEQLFIICSTHGDGDPPEPVETFYSSLLASDTSLKQLNFAVLALGDSSYEKFCETGIQLDNKLSSLGASQLLPRIDCDVDYQEQAESWISSAIRHLAVRATGVTLVTQSEPNTSPSVSKKQPLEVEVLENICLTSPSRTRAIHHIELGLNGVHLDIQPGDSIGVLPQNPPELVSRILGLLDFTGDESVSVDHQAMPLVQAMREHCDLNVVSTKFIKKWAEICSNQRLNSLTNSEPTVIRDYLRQHQLADILIDFGGNSDAQLFIDNLRPLQPRLYDVANSLKQTADECHLTVERYFYKLNGKQHEGIASQYLCDLNESEILQVYPQANKRFRLPINKTVPLILIADGTGIAPYRAFLQELAASPERQHQTWLILQEQHYNDDFLYQLEWQAALESGELTRLDSFFSGDMPGSTLLGCIAADYHSFKGWLQAGAHIYLAGHKSQLEPFQQSLAAALGSDSGMDGIWQQMADEGRIHRNFY